MPIKFRCQHCQQLLGIARSRASAVVDCPQCGRSLRVPDLDGRTRRLPNARADVTSDSALLSALSELSALGDAHAAAHQDNQSAAAEGRSPGSAQTAVLNPMPQSQMVTAEPISALPVVPVRIDDEEDEDPFTLEDSLSELVAFGEDVSPTALSDDLLTEMQRVSHPTDSPLLTIFGCILLLLLGTGLGWWLAHSRMIPGSSLERLEAKPVALNESPPAEPHVAAHNSAEVTGTVKYLDATGQMLPDVGALLILLPGERSGHLKLDARSLLLANDHPDRRATLAALTSLGGAVAQADNAGQFHLFHHGQGDVVVVAVSRNRQRAADVPVSTDVTDALQTWFDSSSNICGRLSANIATVTGGEGRQDFLFRDPE
ncbi:MAG: hypothetical protein R3C59_23425 [Planctomycetaceae bacterium]